MGFGGPRPDGVLVRLFKDPTLPRRCPEDSADFPRALNVGGAFVKPKTIK